MEPRRLLSILRRRAPVLVALLIVGGLVGYLTASRTQTYRAQAILYVGKPIVQGATPTSVFAAEALAVALGPAVTSTQVAGAALAGAGIGGDAAKVAAATSAAAIPGTSLLIVSVADTDPLRSEVLTNATAAAFAKVAADLPTVIVAAGGTPTGTAQGQTQVVSVYRSALLPTASDSSDTSRYVELGGLIALIVGLAVVALVDLTGLTARTARQLETELDLPVLGILPRQAEFDDVLGRAGT